MTMREDELPPLDDLFRPSEIYHENSKLRPSDVPLYTWIQFVNASPEIRHVISKPHASYRGCPIFPLPAEGADRARSLADVVTSRRSSHDFTGGMISTATLGELLYLGDGVAQVVHADDASTWALRTAPSGGGLYPIEVYVIAFRVDGLEPGIYYHAPTKHELQQLRPGHLQADLRAAIPGFDTIDNAAACVILTSVIRRSRFKYGERAYRFCLLECGHIAQNLLLAAEAADLAAVPVGGFIDDYVNALLRLDGVDEAAQYVVVVGTRR